MGNNLFRLPEFHFSHTFRFKYDKVKSSGLLDRFEETLPLLPDRRLRYTLIPFGEGMTIVVEDVTMDWTYNEAQRSALLSLNSMGEAVFLVRASGHVVFANDSASRATGYMRDELTHLSIWNVIPALKKDKLVELNSPSNRRIVFESEMQRSDGRNIPVILSVTHRRLYNADQYIVAAWDITDRKRAEAESESAKQEAELYLDLMGHDINNMHQIALGYLELASNMLPGEEQTEFIHKSVEVLQQSAQLISNVRKLQKLHEGTFQAQEVDVIPVLRDLQREYGSVPNKHVTLNVNGCEHCFVHANELLHDVYANLVTNAIKHTGDRADITIGMDIIKDDVSQYCRVMVEDNGPGILDDKKATIFNRALKGTNKAKGMGLGLYIVKTLVDSYGGRVWVEDRVQGDHSKGARFVVLLPGVES